MPTRSQISMLRLSQGRARSSRLGARLRRPPFPNRRRWPCLVSVSPHWASADAENARKTDKSKTRFGGFFLRVAAEGFALAQGERFVDGSLHRSARHCAAAGHINPI